MNLECIWEECSKLRIELNDVQRDQMAKFLEDLYVVNKHTNLTRIPEEEAPMRHVVDSLLLVPFLPANGRVLDIGCGPGFPAWVLAWVRPDLEVHALDTTLKMQRFLGSHLLPNLKQRIQRAEEGVFRDSFDLVTGRAVAPLGIQAEISAAWLKVGGFFIPFRTISELDSLERINIGMLGLKLRDVVETELPDKSGSRLFPIYEKVKTTPNEYPRTWARIKAKPLGQS